MKLVTTWKEKMNFMASADGHEVLMDTKPPIGNNLALTPKQLVVAGLCGCTAMDVIALLKKHKQSVQKFEVECEVEKSKGTYPEVFTKALLTFKVNGQVDESVLIESVQLSQNKYCGVSAMLSRAFPIQYQIELNGSLIGKQEVAFAKEIK